MQAFCSPVVVRQTQAEGTMETGNFPHVPQANRNRPLLTELDHAFSRLCPEGTGFGLSQRIARESANLGTARGHTQRTRKQDKEGQCTIG